MADRILIYLFNMYPDRLYRYIDSNKISEFYVMFRSAYNKKLAVMGCKLATREYVSKNPEAHQRIFLLMYSHDYVDGTLVRFHNIYNRVRLHRLIEKFGIRTKKVALEQRDDVVYDTLSETIRTTLQIEHREFEDCFVILDHKVVLLKFFIRDMFSNPLAIRRICNPHIVCRSRQQRYMELYNFITRNQPEINEVAKSQISRLNTECDELVSMVTTMHAIVSTMFLSYSAGNESLQKQMASHVNSLMYASQFIEYSVNQEEEVEETTDEIVHVGEKRTFEEHEYDSQEEQYMQLFDDYPTNSVLQQQEDDFTSSLLSFL